MDKKELIEDLKTKMGVVKAVQFAMSIFFIGFLFKAESQALVIFIASLILIQEISFYNTSKALRENMRELIGDDMTEDDDFWE